MESKIAKAIKLQTQPVAIYRTPIIPENAIKFKSGVWGCVVSLLVAASKGKTAVCDRETVVCKGGRAGLGIERYKLGEIEYFLSTGGNGARGVSIIKKHRNLHLYMSSLFQIGKLKNALFFNHLIQ